MTKTQDYPYLRAWCRHMGSHQYYTDMQLERAREENAPVTAIYRDVDDEGKSHWHTFESISREDTRETIRKMVEG